MPSLIPIRRHLAAIWLGLVLVLSAAMPVQAATSDFLEVDQAFQYDLSPAGAGEASLRYTIAPGYYLYKERMAVSAPGGAALAVRYSPARIKHDPYFDEDREVFEQRAELRFAVPAGARQLVIDYQGCALEGLCFPPEQRTIDVPPALIAASASRPAPARDLPAAPGAILGAVLMAMLGGLILNLMPCVFPVLALKALSIVRSQAEGLAVQRRSAIAYGAGVMGSFLALGGLLLVLRHAGLAVGWGFQLQAPALIAALVLLFFAMALSLSGLVNFGAGAMGVGQTLATRGGLTGSFFTGVLAAVVASPCTAPFMGAAMGFALVQPDLVAILIFAALGAGMALPLVLLPFVPALAHRIPRPGAWMETVKHVAAFPLYLTCVWLLWVLMRQAGPDSAALVMVGMVLLAAALWRHARHQRRGTSVTAAGLGLAAVGLALAPLAMPAAEAHPDRPVAAAADAAGTYSAARLAALRAEGKPVFVDLGADWCITCLVNEKVALRQPAVQDAMARGGIVLLKGDWTNRDPEITQLLAANGRSGVPLYLFYPAGQDRPVILPQLLTQKAVLDVIASDASPKAAATID